MSKPSVQTHDRITTRLVLTFERHEEEPHQISVTCSHLLVQTGVEIYSRKCVATEDWQELDLGWVERNSVAKVIVENLEKDEGNVGLSGVGVLSAGSKFLQVAYDGAVDYCLYIAPQDALPAIPNPACRLMIRSVRGEIPFRVHVIPGRLFA